MRNFIDFSSLPGCGCAAVTVNGVQLRLPDNWFEDSWSYECAGGGTVSVLWQLYRPLLGNTVEIETGAHGGCVALENQ